jgi:hypothetical protein
MKLYEQKGKDLFVASYTLNQRETGGHESYSVWSKTVPALLPKTDLSAFFDPTKPESQRTLGLAKWNDVMRIASRKPVCVREGFPACARLDMGGCFRPVEPYQDQHI